MKLKKILLFAIGILCLSLSHSALAGINVGIKVGASTSSLMIGPHPRHLYNFDFLTVNKKWQWSIGYGGYVYIPFSEMGMENLQSFSLQLEVMAQNKGARMFLQQLYVDPVNHIWEETESSIWLYYVCIPLLLRWEPFMDSSGPYLTSGLSMNFLSMSKQSVLEDTLFVFREEVSKMDLGFVVTLGYTFKFAISGIPTFDSFIELRWEYGILDIDPTYHSSTHNQICNLLVGLNFDLADFHH